jgi:uncharacterized iron-regulated membrane protein
MGVSLLVFLLFLAVTGMALNHAADLGLDRRYVSWSWLLDAYGIGPPEPYAGKVTLGSLAVIGDGQRAHVLLASGELVESIDLGGSLPGSIERVGLVDDRAVLQSGGKLYRSDEDVTVFEPWAGGTASDVSWSAEVEPEAAGLEALQTAWRGQGLTVERLLLDLHSGRILAVPGRLLLDILAIGMILLSISGLVLANTRRRNGQ